MGEKEPKDMTKLQVKNYSIYSPVKIQRITSGAIRGKGQFLITEKPKTGSAFNTEKLMAAIIYGKDAKYFGV